MQKYKRDDDMATGQSETFPTYITFIIVYASQRVWERVKGSKVKCILFMVKNRLARYPVFVILEMSLRAASERNCQNSALFFFYFNEQICICLEANFNAV